MENAPLIIGIILAFLSNFSAITMSIIAWKKSKKTTPLETKGIDLDNEKKELSLAEIYDDIARKAAQDAVRLQKELDDMKTTRRELSQNYTSIEKKYTELEKTVKQQANTIKEQAERLNKQDDKIKTQEEEISLLLCELKNAKLYNIALIQQMKEANVIPTSASEIQLFDCSDTSKKNS